MMRLVLPTRVNKAVQNKLGKINKERRKEGTNTLILELHDIYYTQYMTQSLVTVLS